MVGSRSRSRWIAACASLWLLACGLLTAHHVAAQPHVLDASGNAVHAAPAIPRHAPARDVRADRDDREHAVLWHGAAHDADHGACALTPLPSSAALAQLPGALARPLAPAPASAPRPLPARAIAALYRLAPKTSPPSRPRIAST